MKSCPPPPPLVVIESILKVVPVVPTEVVTKLFGNENWKDLIESTA